MAASLFGSDMELVRELPAGWTLERLQQKAKVVVEEYVLSLDLAEATTACRELLSECPCPDELCIVAMRTALERSEAKQDSLAGLLCTLQKESILSTSSLVRSFEKLFCMWQDLAIDSPKTPQYVLAMLQVCVEREVLGNAFLSKLPESLIKAGVDSNGGSSPFNDRLALVADEMKEYKTKVGTQLEEYFISLKSKNLQSFLKEIDMPAYHHEFVKKAIILAYSQPSVDSACESVVQLFAVLIDEGMLKNDNLLWGVLRILGQLDELALDTPKCAEFTTEMLSKMVILELLSAPFIRRCRLLRIGGATGVQVLEATKRKTPEHSKRNLDTAQFKQEIQTMILEFFNSADKNEFIHCVSDLAPLSEAQSAELLRKIMTLAMEKGGTECVSAIELITHLRQTEEVDEGAVERALDQLYERMPDLMLDIPDAAEMAASFVVEAKKVTILREEWQMPMAV